ncbi:hypothetical protein [Sphingomonas sp.]|uniref:hypothetical protein n=1 Tax=Sphingomonas sp. TaxID=28214 RepID=UPI0026003B26|nr:hypothetical protein [Sphingomonas sp.]
MRKILIAALIFAPAALSTPAFAQTANDRVLTIFGDDTCPKDTICVRASEAERYRIPKQFRNSGPIAPSNQSWAARAQGTIDAGARSGTGSCSTSGGGGWTGCYLQQMRDARAEREADVKAAPDVKP